MAGLGIMLGISIVHATIGDEMNSTGYAAAFSSKI